MIRLHASSLGAVWRSDNFGETLCDHILGQVTQTFSWSPKRSSDSDLRSSIVEISKMCRWLFPCVMATGLELHVFYSSLFHGMPLFYRFLDTLLVNAVKGTTSLKFFRNLFSLSLITQSKLLVLPIPHCPFPELSFNLTFTLYKIFCKCFVSTNTRNSYSIAKSQDELFRQSFSLSPRNFRTGRNLCATPGI
jgi:hypothetical protein